MASYAVVAWKKQGGSDLNPEQLEVCQLKKLILSHNPPKIGTQASMQFKQSLWEGSIISLHEKKKDADKDINNVEALADPIAPLSKERKRKKKSFGDDFVDCDEQENKEKQKETNTSSKMQGKTKKIKKSKKQEIPKAKNAEKQKTKSQEKTIEQQRLLLTRMSNLDSELSDEDSDDDDDDDVSFVSARSVVDECMEILNGSSSSQVHKDSKQSPTSTATSKTVKTHAKKLNTSFTTADVAHQNQITSLLTGTQTHTNQLTPLTTPDLAHNIELTPSTTAVTQNDELINTPLTTAFNISQPNISPHIQLQPRNLSYQSNSPSALTPPPTPRPQFGGKCPRRRPVTEDCSSCQLLRDEILQLKQQLALYQDNDQDSPRPGKLNPALAAKFKMIELSPGSCVFVYEKHVDQAMCKKSATACASFLMNCFYTNTEMEGMNLSGANGKPHPEKAVLDSIIAFTVKKFNSSTAAAIKVALRNKFAANNCRAGKRATTR